ncbi:MAG: gamma-glutamylcyclotransferase, partial [Pirellulales bacterium]|nr:gamma-glutamylcyclotransferase [Pirellulales bacterium]
MNGNRHGGFVNLHSAYLEISSVTSVFVYGTLKQGECRAHCWPHRPMDVRAASIRGNLFDLGPYPALLEGGDRVLGECWMFVADQMRETLEVLDQIECFGQEGVDLYVRRIVRCRSSANAETDAHAYFLADSSAV